MMRAIASFHTESCNIEFENGYLRIYSRTNKAFKVAIYGYSVLPNVYKMFDQKESIEMPKLV